MSTMCRSRWPKASGVEGRGAYYDHAGAIRDMVQNHLLQLLCLTAMEPPAKFDPNDVRNEKLKVLHALEPINERQYRGACRARICGAQRGHGLSRRYRRQRLRRPRPSSRSRSTSRTGAGRACPSMLRTGKRLALAALGDRRHLQGRAAFDLSGGGGHGAPANALVIRLQPHEGITLLMTIKDPGPAACG